MDSFIVYGIPEDTHFTAIAALVGKCPYFHPGCSVIDDLCNRQDFPANQTITCIKKVLMENIVILCNFDIVQV